MNRRTWLIALAVVFALALLVAVVLFRWIPSSLAAALSSSLALIVLAARARPRPAGNLAARAHALRGVGASPAVADLLARGQKIGAIKAYREERGTGLREAKDAIESLEPALA